MIKTIPCVIFAGGKSKRMGRDKSLLPFGGFESLTLYQMMRFKPCFENVFISCKDKNKFDFEGNFIEDIKDFKDHSPLIALVSVFEQLKHNHIFVLSVDSPFFGMDDFYRLYENIDKGFDAVVAKQGDKIHPLCAIYSKEILLKAKEFLKNKKHRLQTLLEESKTEYVCFDKKMSFANLNYQKDYENAKRISKW